MRKNFILIVILLALGALSGVALYLRQPQTEQELQQVGPKNITYIIDGKSVTLKEGVSVDSVTRYFGNEVRGDFDGDGREDMAFLLTQNPGGSGTFYYIVAALNTSNGYVGSHGLLLGDRIAPQTTETVKSSASGDGIDTITVNYADRKPEDSFAIAPSVGKTLRLKLDPTTMQFGEVMTNFEGEANPATMKLNMQTWTWQETTYNDGKIIRPRLANKFTVTFKDGNIFSASTDCNGIGGEYTAGKNLIAFTKMMSTLMYCEGSQESDFSKSLSEVASYHFTSKGELVFDLKFDSGVMVFR